MVWAKLIPDIIVVRGGHKTSYCSYVTPAMRDLHLVQVLMEARNRPVTTCHFMLIVKSSVSVFIVPITDLGSTRE